MATKHINYIKRDFNGIREELVNYSKANYPQLSDNFGNDASISSWIIDLLSDCTDSLNYHIDRVFQDTQLNSTNSRSALLNIARSNGLKVPGPKAGMCEVKFSCILPAGYYDPERQSVDISMPNWNAAPIIQRNCSIAAGNLSYIIDENVDFSEQFNSDAYSNRTYVPRRDSNGQVTGYTVSKTVLATAGNRKVYKKILTSDDVTPFMEILLPDKDVMNIESVIFKASSNINISPEISEYYIDEEEYQFKDSALTTYRFFETDALVNQWRWGAEMSNIDDEVVKDKYNPEAYVDYTESFDTQGYTASDDILENIVAKYNYQITSTSERKIPYRGYFEITNGGYAGIYQNVSISEDEVSLKNLYLTIKEGGSWKNFNTIKVSTPNSLVVYSQRTSRIYKGKWKPLRQKFITEYTDNGYMKLIFGAGVDYNEYPTDAVTYTQYRMSSIINNDMMGVLPKVGWTMYVLYTTGGGVETNIAAGAINTFKSMQADFPKFDNDTRLDSAMKGEILRSMTVTNTTVGVNGKDTLSNAELKNYIKYNTGAQNRCVTIKDYQTKVMDMPPKYGAPFRCAAMEENNKIVLSLLGINQDGTLYKALPSTLVDNMINYLSYYKSINDYIEIKSGKIYNVGFLVDIFADKSYNAADVVANVITTVRKYMDVNNQDMGQDIFIGDLNKEVSELDGVVNLIDLKVYKISGGGYSTDTCPLPSTTDNKVSECYGIDEPGFTIDGALCEQIDLDKIDSVLLGDAVAMYELKNPNACIRVRVKNR